MMATNQAHRIVIDGPPGNLRAQTWRCSCGKWESKVPDVGPWGRATNKARIAQVKMAHGKHVSAAEAKARATPRATGADGDA